MKTEHTPTPWKCNFGNGTNLTYDSTIWDANGAVVASIGDNSASHLTLTDQANARFICQAVNSHDELVEALEDVASGCTIPKKRLQRLLAKAKGEV